MNNISSVKDFVRGMITHPSSTFTWLKDMGVFLQSRLNSSKMKKKKSSSFKTVYICLSSLFIGFNEKSQ